MRFYFLRAEGVRLSKRFRLENSTLVKEAYPHAYEFTSFAEDCPDLPTLATTISAHGQQGHCLLKGLLSRDLNKESRAGSTKSDEMTAWVCLDLDGANFRNPDDFLAAIGYPDTSYVLQWSASSGIDPTQTGLRCHLFMMLDRPMHPALLKQWLQHLNLTVPDLRTGTALTKTSCALTWPLDVTTCQNDKLLYIAPPELDTGIHDPYGAMRTVYMKRGKETLTLPNEIPSVTVLRTMMDKRLNELRESVGLPKRRATAFKQAGMVEYMVKPEQAVVTSTKQERGFVYLNLNGGDSFAYYHPEDNPEFIYNFKGEPTYKTEELCPQYYNEAREALRRSHEGTRTYLAFREFNQSTYWNGWYEESTDTLRLSQARSADQLHSFLKQHGLPKGDFIPDWEMVWDPNLPCVVDHTKKIVNTFKRTEIMKLIPSPRDDLPPLTKRLILHLLGIDQDKDPEYEAFNNWMACILQHRKQTYCAWLLQGTQGTGKGLFIQRVLRPILGDACDSLRMEQLEENFTDFLENKLILVIEEIQTGASQKAAKIIAKLKTIIADTEISMRKLYQPARLIKNSCNVIYTSNMSDAIELPSDDRRTNVGRYQPARIPLSMAEIRQIEDGVELFEAYSYWMTREADLDKARFPLDNEARRQLIDTTMRSADSVAQALTKGNMQFFVELLPTQDDAMKVPNTESAFDSLRVTAAYRELVKEIVLTNKNNLARDELRVLFQYCIGSVPLSPNKFTSYLRHHRIHMDYVWNGQRSVRGVQVHWHADPAWLAQTRADLSR